MYYTFGQIKALQTFTGTSRHLQANFNSRWLIWLLLQITCNLIKVHWCKGSSYNPPPQQVFLGNCYQYTFHLMKQQFYWKHWCRKETSIHQAIKLLYRYKIPAAITVWHFVMRYMLTFFTGLSSSHWSLITKHLWTVTFTSCSTAEKQLADNTCSASFSIPSMCEFVYFLKKFSQDRCSFVQLQDYSSLAFSLCLLWPFLFWLLEEHKTHQSS